GTFVNGRPIDEQEIFPGDEIQLGSIVNLLFTNAADDAERLAQQRTTRARVLSEHMYVQRIESLANVVTRVAHELGTPLGVARTANGMIACLADQIGQKPSESDLTELLKDLRDASALLNRGLERASRVISDFKRLSIRHLSDDYVPCDLRQVVDEWKETVTSDP